MGDGCKPGSHDPNDAEGHRTPWSCAVLSCAADYSDDCTKTKCCQNPQSYCYQKNEHWATCKPSCTQGLTKMIIQITRPRGRALSSNDAFCSICRAGIS